jgi:hypothetical protein
MEKQKIEITNSMIASPGAAITFIFSTYSILSWAQLLGLLKDGNQLMVGIVQLCLAVGFLAGSIVNILRGNPFGAVNLIFAVVFGIVGGVNGIVTTYFNNIGIVYDSTVVSITFLLAGIFVAGILPTLISLPFYSFLLNFTAAIGLVVLGLAGIMGLGQWSYILSGWMFMITGCCGMYNAISEVCNDCGVYLPQGPALKK